MEFHEDGVTPPGRQAIFFSLCMLNGLSAFDQNALLSALPRIGEEFDARSSFALIDVSYFFSSAAVVLFYGRFCDLFGRSRTIMASIVFFILGSVGCALSTRFGGLVAFRALQGIGAGGFLTLTQVVIADMVPIKQRPNYAATFLTTLGLSSVAGSPLGSLITTYLGWRANMWLNVPLGLITLYLLCSHLPRKAKNPAAPIDLWGSVILLAFILCLFLTASFYLQTLSFWILLAGAALAAVLMMALIGVERSQKMPLLELGLFSIKGLRRSYAMTFLTNFAPVAAVTLLPVYIQVVKGASLQATGVILSATALGVIVGARLGVAHANRSVDYKSVIGTGLAILAVAAFVLATADHFGLPLWLFFLGLAAIGIGIGYSQPALLLLTQRYVAGRSMGSAMGVGGLLRIAAGGFAASAAAVLLKFHEGGGMVGGPQSLLGMIAASNSAAAICPVALHRP